MTATKGKKYRKNHVFYQPSVEDIQTVATEVYGRRLSDDEIGKILDPVADRIPWYDAIEYTISDVLNIEGQEDNEEEYV